MDPPTIGDGRGRFEDDLVGHAALIEPPHVVRREALVAVSCKLAERDQLLAGALSESMN